jgi:hypothetical protein
MSKIRQTIASYVQGGAKDLIVECGQDSGKTCEWQTFYAASLVTDSTKV